MYTHLGSAHSLREAHRASRGCRQRSTATPGTAPARNRSLHAGARACARQVRVQHLFQLSRELLQSRSLGTG